MAKTIQVRHVPDKLHQRLKVRAEASGMSRSDYLRVELDRVSTELTPVAFRRRLAALKPTHVRESAADAVRAVRDAG